MLVWFHFGVIPFWFKSIWALFRFGLNPFLSYSVFVWFHFGLIPFWSYSILVLFRFGLIPFWSDFILVWFCFGLILIWSHSDLVSFHFGPIPFLSFWNLKFIIGEQPEIIFHAICLHIFRCHTGGTRGWLGVERWQLCLQDTSRSAKCQKASSGSLGFIVCVQCCRMVDSVPIWHTISIL